MDAKPKGDGSKAPAKGIPWMTYIGILILLLIVGGIIYVWAFIWVPSKDNRLLNSIAELAPGLQEMQSLTKSQIREQARGIEAADLGKDPTGWGTQYYMVEGTVSQEESAGIDQNIALNIFSDTKFKGYLLDESVVLIDLTGEGPEVPDGTVIRGYGKIFSVNIGDIWKLPVVGPNLKKEFETAGMERGIAFFLSQGVDVLSVPKKDGGPAIPPAQAEGPGAQPPAEEGAAPPPEGSAAPPAEGTPPPAEGGTTPPPAEGGTTPPPAEGGTTPPPAAPPAGK